MKINSMSALLNDEFYFKFCGTVIGHNIDTTKKYFCTSQMRNYNRFFYICNGTFYITPKGGKEIPVRSSHFILLPRGIEYTARWEGENCEYLGVKFHLTAEERDSVPNIELLVDNDGTGACLRWFKEIHNIWNSGKLGYKLHCNAVLYELLRCICINSLENQVNKSCRPILKGIMYLENNYTADITTDELAQMCNMSTSNFRKYFQKYSEYAPITYRNVLRIKKAAELLKTNEYTINEAAEAVNINDIYYFCKMFKKVIGVTPKKYCS